MLRANSSALRGEHAKMPHSFDIIGLGEVLWDCFPDRRLPGGAPANVAFHAQQLGLTAAVATRVGSDPLGDELLEFLRSKGLRTELVQRDPVHGTGMVTVEPHAHGADYTFLENSAWDFLEPTGDWIAAAGNAKAICFGTLAQRGEYSRQTIRQMLAAAGSECLIAFDVNLRPPFFEPETIHDSLQHAQIVKLNDEEVRTLTAMFGPPTRTDVEFARWLMNRYPAELVCITRGPNGALAMTRDEVCEVSGIEIEVVDTVGAGDAFTAALIKSRLEGWPLEESLQFANHLGALVAGRPGAMAEVSVALD
jgi:fructokinase